MSICCFKECLGNINRYGHIDCIRDKRDVFETSRTFPLVDELIMDFKHYDSDKHREIMGLGNDVIRENLKKAISEHPNLLMRIPLIGNVNATEKDIEQFLSFLNRYDVSNVRFELLCYHEYGKEKWAKCGKEYKMKDAFVSEDLRIKYENKMRMHGLNIVRT